MMDLPTGVDELTAAWFSDALERDVSEADIVDRTSGMTRRARVA